MMMMMKKKHNNNNNNNTQYFNSLSMEALNSAPTSTTTSTSSPSPPPLAINRASRPISKPKPKIRIIHIFAPEIIKTDAANFRELVQRLTGKPAAKIPKSAGKMTSPPPPPAVKEEELVSYGGGGFLGGFPDLDGYFNVQDLCELPFYPLDPPQYTMHNNVMDHEPQLIA